MKQTTFSFPQVINRTTRKIELSSDTKSINECLGVLLRTRPGELLGDPNYGCNLIERVFMYNGVIIEPLIRDDIINAIADYEPRIICNSNDIAIIQTGDTVKIYIQYTIKDTNQVNTFNLELSHDDNPYV